MNLTTQLLVLGTLFGRIYAEGCSKEDHQRCVPLADPLLKDPQLIFPDNMKDIDNVCRTWSSFVDCIQKYIEKCFSKQRREQFNSAVEVPIASVHQMCSVSTYQAEYLKYASCMKATVIELEHCGNEYAALVNEVSRSDVTKANLCCAHHHFRTCVVTETKKNCDGNDVEGTAAKFARQNLDKALSFLQDQCQNYIPNGGSCVRSSASVSISPIGDSTNIIGTQSRPNHRSSSPDMFPRKTTDHHDTFSNTRYTTTFKGTGRALIYSSSSAPKAVSNDDSQASSAHVYTNSPSQITEASSGEPVTETNDVPSLESTISNVASSDEQSAIVVTQRPPNYGRGMSWTSSTRKPTSEIPAWATSTWLNSNQDLVTDNSWYPAAGTFGGNNIDEPNQQGLSKSGHMKIKMSCVCYIIILAFFCI